MVRFARVGAGGTPALIERGRRIHAGRVERAFFRASFAIFGPLRMPRESQSEGGETLGSARCESGARAVLRRRRITPRPRFE